MENSANDTLAEDESGVALGICYVVVTSLVLLSNAIVIFVIIKTPKLRHPTLWVMAHMAFGDFMQGLNVFVFVIPSVCMNRFAYTVNILEFAACCGAFFAGVNVFNTATIVTDRFINLLYPFIYKKIATGRVYTFAALCVNILAIVRMLVIAFPDRDYTFETVLYISVYSINTQQEIIISMGLLALAFGTMIILSGAIVITIKRRRRRIGRLSVSHNMIKLSTMTVLSAGVFCLSYIPVMIVTCYDITVGKESVSKAWKRFAMLTVFSNSIWNVLIYTANNTIFQEAFIRIFCRSYYLRNKRRRQGINTIRIKVFPTNNKVFPNQMAHTGSASPNQQI